MSGDDVGRWPEESLETLGCCPVCCSDERKTVQPVLRDIFFKSAPGDWALHQCSDCQTAYLDPRPDEQSIGKAYNTYYTHSDAGPESVVGKLLQSDWFAKGYNGRLNKKYGLKRQPASKALGMLLSFIPFVGHFFDPLGRAVPRLPFSNARLLDFGCGDGRFLQVADEAGWSCAGIDFDPLAVEVAQSKALNVKLGGLSDLEAASGYDLITLSHVIEHVHDPRRVISACYNALNPGGSLWMETPNINAFGHDRYGAEWRGLECPRHLCIFTPNSLAGLMAECGFEEVRNSPRLFVNLTTYSASLHAGQARASGAKSLSDILRPLPVWDGIRSIFLRDRTEFIQVSGRKS